MIVFLWQEYNAESLKHDNATNFSHNKSANHLIVLENPS